MGPGEEFRYGFQFLEVSVFLIRGAHDLIRVTEPSGAVNRKQGWDGGRAGGLGEEAGRLARRQCNWKEGTESRFLLQGKSATCADR